MEKQELIKLAYAYGVSTALQEAGMQKEAADQEAVAFVEEQIKTAREATTKERILNLVPFYGALTAEEGNKLNTLGETLGYGVGGMLGGGVLGAGAGALASLLAKRKIIPQSIGAGLNNIGTGFGGLLGSIYGSDVALRSARSIEAEDEQ